MGTFIKIIFNKMDFRRVGLLYITGFCLLFFSCESEESCEQSIVSALNAGFYSVPDSIPESISVDNFTVYGIGRADSLIYDQASSVGSFVLPLSPSCDTTGFVFTLGVVTDTVTFLYSRELHLLSMECGFTTYYYIKMTDNTSNVIDSISVVKKNVTTGNDENIQIYL